MPAKKETAAAKAKAKVAATAAAAAAADAAELEDELADLSPAERALRHAELDFRGRRGLPPCNKYTASQNCRLLCTIPCR